MGNRQSAKRRALLFDSARAGDLPRVRELVQGGTTVLCLVQRGVNVDATDDAGRTALMLAAANGHETIVRLLIEYGANVNAIDSDGKSALALAAENGHVDVVRWLVEHGAELVATDGKEWSPLALAIENDHLNAVRYLVEHGADVNASGHGGETPLMRAIEENHMGVIRCLVEWGVDVDATDDVGTTALMLAAANGHETIVRFLFFCGVNTNATDQSGKSALALAAEKGHVDVVQFLLEHGVALIATGSKGWSLLVFAVENGHLDVVRYLVEHEADVNLTDRDGRALSVLAEKKGFSDVAVYLAHARVHMPNRDERGDGLPATDNDDDQTTTTGESTGVDNERDAALPVRAAAERGYGGIPLFRDGRRDEANAVGREGGRPHQVDATPCERGGGLPTVHEDDDQPHTTEKPATSPEWFLHRVELQVDNWVQPLGRGGFGRVYRAKWLNSDVVVKEVIIDKDRESQSSLGVSSSTPWTASSSMSRTTHSRALLSKTDGWSILQVFKREADIWFRLHHPHVVQLFGACDDTSGGQLPIFVSEYATNGSLDKYLKAHPEALWQKLHEAALSIQYLHERGIVHGDLKCDNIVVGSDLKAKLTDFGLSSASHQAEPANVPISGAVQWVAPECLGDDHEPATFESDIYSLGMCIIQALRIVEVEHFNKDVRQFPPFPWESVPDAVVVFQVKRQQQLPSRPETCTDEQWMLVKKMCAFNPKERANISTVASVLESMAHLRQPELGYASVFHGGEFEMRWSEVQRQMDEIDTSTLQQLAYRDLQVIIARLQRSNRPQRLADEVFRLLNEIIVVDLFQRHRILRLASSRSSPGSLREFGRRLQRIWFELSLPGDEEAHAMSEDIMDAQVDLLVSESPPMWLLSADFDSEDDRLDFLAFLKVEAEGDASKYSYSPHELDLIRSAYEDIGRGRASMGKPRWFVPWYELEIDKWTTLGNGGFSVVSRGKWLDSDVVVKQLRWLQWTQRESVLNSSRSSFSSSGSDRDEFPAAAAAERQALIMREADIWFSLSHPHVVRLYGACHVGEPFFVCEYASNGSLDRYLGNHPDQIWAKLLEAALGVQYLHERYIVHGDLKCNNIVVGGDGKAKVTDFALSSAPSATEENPQISGAWHWVAPECLVGSRPTHGSDIYSLGMCIVEAMRVVEYSLLGQGHRESPPYPWGHLENAAVKYLVTKRQELPRRPSTCSDSQWDLVDKMCRFDPHGRITISVVVDKLQEQAGVGVSQL